jgi:hypothetical protein
MLRCDRLAANLWIWTCNNCPWHWESDTDEEVLHECGQPGAVRISERLTDALGEGWREIGLPPVCWDKRREWLKRLENLLKLDRQRTDALRGSLGWGM